MKKDRDSPRKVSHETPSRLQEASRELIENYSSVMVLCFLFSIILCLGSFFYSFSLNRKMDNSNEIFERLRHLERGERLEKLENRVEKIELSLPHSSK